MRAARRVSLARPDNSLWGRRPSPMTSKLPSIIVLMSAARRQRAGAFCFGLMAAISSDSSSLVGRHVAIERRVRQWGREQASAHIWKSRFPPSVLAAHIQCDDGFEERQRLVSQLSQQALLILLVDLRDAREQGFHQLALAPEVVLDGGELDPDALRQTAHGEALQAVFAEQVFRRAQDLVPAPTARCVGLGLVQPRQQPVHHRRAEGSRTR